MEDSRKLNTQIKEKRDDHKEDSLQFLSFFVGGELFAVDIQRIKEIIEYNGVTKIPMMQKFLKGVINLRGNVVPVVALSERFDRESREVTKKTSIIVVEVMTDEGLINVGMLVDEVDEVVEIPQSQIENAPEFGSKIRNTFLQGIGKINNRFIMLLSIGNVLQVDELSVLQEMDRKGRFHDE